MTPHPRHQVVPLPDGRMLAASRASDHDRTQVVTMDDHRLPWLMEEETRPPATAIGTAHVAVVMGRVPRPTSPSSTRRMGVAIGCATTLTRRCRNSPRDRSSVSGMSRSQVTRPVSPRVSNEPWAAGSGDAAWSLSVLRMISEMRAGQRIFADAT